jgi:(1->4)-alpha-D-glucan 1-alpha-D-glucosylmutase
VAELLACFPVYRSYLPDGRDHLDEALSRARARRPDLDEELTALAPVLGDAHAAAAQRFQQSSGMVMAKGVEDCAFYRYARLSSLNEVGGDPSWFALAPEDFHDAMARRQQLRPDAMTALSTHDTKRAEDVRARISVLAEVPDLWEQALDGLLHAAPVPDPAFGALLWQAVLGAWPGSSFGEPPEDLRSRLHGYAEKAMREAGVHTSWTQPDTTYEKSVHEAVDAAFDHAGVRAILAEVLDRVVVPGWSNALVAKLVALTAPGACDVYEGSELWELSLVDPDNRRPVDFGQRRALLDDLDETGTPASPAGPTDVGVAKLWVVRTALRLRRDRPELFGSYAPVAAQGPAAAHVLAFDRGGALTVGTRLPIGLERQGGWADTTLSLPPGRWRNALASGSEVLQGEVLVADLLRSMPVALRVQEG